MRYYAVLLLLSTTQAFQLPFHIPNFFSAAIPATHAEQSPISGTPRIAIIGAGAGGSSAAFWIAKAKERFGVDVEIDVYERNGYIGGRSTIVYPYNDSSLPELELGASIFVEANKNLWRASDEFNLTRRDFHDQDYETGIWDGEKVLVSFSGGWWDTAKVLWRYGFLSPKRTESFVRNMINRILVLYGSETPKWDSILDLSSFLGWTEITNTTTSKYLSRQGVSEQYVSEVVEAATRVNYGQNVDEIHALEGACALAGTGASGIAGGNFQMFEKFLNHSGASVYLNTPVTAILPSSSSSQLWSVKSGRGATDYKSVILAAPFHSTGIKFPLSISDQVPEIPYVHLHVTLLSTTSTYPNPAYFGLPSSSTVPRMMLTTNQGARDGRTKPEFNSLSYHGLVRDGEWAVKIFSENALSDEWLNNMFQGQVGWVLRKDWDAYPKLPPTSNFPPVKLDRGLYYVNSFEPFISTMETETVSSRNTVDLMLNDEFDASICGRKISAAESAEKPLAEESTVKDFIFGWDC
ncbi:hypothetical protein GALMADRAFT_51898 [Galerina marginata CBS 339.88]|uniref:Prenylcysteine lyase domain-containing protein n=1 Tax=Galerina marginata (strain CBS 339.88) TaxID=685588 RepID=A0A067TQ18_GALM3|nr:hypothetical protein GALMADRAFT_51898 [Galerina marginata CBS 339.88]